MLKYNDLLISASYAKLGQLRLFPIQKAPKNISIQNKSMISSISSISYKPKNLMID